MKSLEVGIPVDALDLLSLPFQMSREEYLALVQNSIKTADEFFESSKESLGLILEPDTLQAYVSIAQIDE